MPTRVGQKYVIVFMKQSTKAFHGRFHVYVTELSLAQARNPELSGRVGRIEWPCGPERRVPMPKARVLIVEDDSLVRELVTEALAQAGFQVDQPRRVIRRQS